MAAVSPRRVSDDRKSAPRSNALARIFIRHRSGWNGGLRDFNAPGRSIGYSARRVLSPVRLRLALPSLFFRTGSPKDRSSCRIPTRSLARGRGIFAVGVVLHSKENVL